MHSKGTETYHNSEKKKTICRNADVNDLTMLMTFTPGNCVSFLPFAHIICNLLSILNYISNLFVTLERSGLKEEKKLFFFDCK